MAVLVGKIAAELVLGIDGLADAQVDVALVAEPEHGDLIVIARAAGKVGQRVEIQQALSLRADRNGSESRDNPVALVLSGHQASKHAGIAIPRQLVVDKEKCFFAAQQFRNFQRPAESAGRSEMVVLGLGRFLAGEREGLRIQRRVVQDHCDVAVVLAASIAARVSERACVS